MFKFEEVPAAYISVFVVAFLISRTRVFVKKKNNKKKRKGENVALVSTTRGLPYGTGITLHL
jgi:hypothetical protein